ncbi:FT-interacting protein 3-like [Magnolia sinica]|uniref:FT-interacting protein 3-like n=1 Tax=Magnolia sinica TaxID=86752 RepID=UPI002659E32C|nr:FT-interacting protein 3-like [Magnolia sinica]
MKLVVEVQDASDLMPKDGNGSASPFVEVDFDDQRHRTQTKPKDLNPVWNERLTFNVTNPAQLPDQTIDVTVYNESKRGHHKNFLGRVRISGVSVPRSESESAVQRYPLDKRGLFSHIRGDIALKIYAVYDSSPPGPPLSNGVDPPIAPPDTNVNQGSGGGGGGDDHNSNRKKNKKNSNKANETQSWYSVGSGPPPGPPIFDFMKPAPAPVSQPSEAKRTDHSRNEFVGGVPVTLHHVQMPPKPPEFGLVETAPPLPGRLYGHRRDKTASTYDLVEQMYYLYVNVVKAKDLPVMDITGSLDPYVEVKLGNYKGVTKIIEKNQNPVWRQVFAFPKERLQSSLIEVVVKDKDFLKDDFVGRLTFDLTEVPVRVPPDSPLAPQWYKLEDKKGEKAKGEVMLAVWMGTQADEAFSEARHADAHDLPVEAEIHTRSQVYYSPKLYYLRVLIIEAQDLVPSEKGRVPEPWVKVQLENQMKYTRTSQIRTRDPTWNEELMFVASEPLDQRLVITVEDRVGPNKSEPLGWKVLPLSAAVQRLDHHKPVPPRWFNLDKPSSSAETDEKKKEVKFSSKIHLSLCLDAGYHVLDESTHYSSDLQPSAKHLRKPMIGILELGILNAKNLMPMKTKEGRATDAYCVAKYGSKWIRTRTALDTLIPRWNEQYTWEVHDPCTVITIAVFDNCQITGKKDDGPIDQRIGKVRIRLSTLEMDRIYTHYYPLLVLHPSGLKKMGELHLAVRFTCMAWINMLTLYSRPLLPKMHYVQPIPVLHVDFLRRQATLIVAARLSRSEPPLRREVVEYMLDVDSHMWSLRRSKANFHRITSLLSGFLMIGKWFDDVRNWKNPVTTCLVHVLFFILVCYPELILPTVFLYLFMIGIWNYRFRPRDPPHMDVRLSHADRAHPDELDEEFDTFPTSRPSDIVRMRYDRLRSVAGRMQTVAGDLATQGERAHALLSWRDPRATAIFIMLSLILAVILYVTPFQVVAVIYGLYLLRHPRFRSKLPSAPFNFYKRLPAKSDMLI